ncbi:N-acetyltransferase 8-like 2 [Megalops cyprinoides]|uniref:N-acetyltransferase 8-like 2 n=1 Tax=Megalops cyprinoides TaxID=118141 RepID=UPI0018652021|nr:N-acetyltransferase 8-like 2 [Megalops cyprinoides]
MQSLTHVQYVIRCYQPSDQEAINSLYRETILEHIYPAFRRAMSHPQYICVTLSICLAGYVLGGGSYFLALLAGGAWVTLVYFSCHKVYDSYVRYRLQRDIGHIQEHYLSDSDSCFWVAVAEVNGRSGVIGMVGLGQDKDPRGGQGYGDVVRMVVSPSCRRAGVGSRLTQTAVEFCQERGFSRVLLETTTSQTAAIPLYRKLGFKHIHTHSDTETSRWVTKLARVGVLVMEKIL